MELARRQDIVIDIQGFQLAKGGGFVLKELAAACINTHQISHHLFKPPHSFGHLFNHQKRTSRWLENNYLGVKWSDGYTDLIELRSILQQICCTENTERPRVYCKGEMKRCFLQPYLKDYCEIINLENVPSVLVEPLRKLSLSPACMFHNAPNIHCALSNVIYLCKCIETL